MLALNIRLWVAVLPVVRFGFVQMNKATTALLRWYVEKPPDAAAIMSDENSSGSV